ncbi:MAG: hypothetical protein OEL56_01990 [Nitrosopumilus sp.]|nr:hypothetical protein [Nitrosopumilus sp.]MDH3489197.1 hypothetical protein [Nitrosopumilus sp.]MDH3516196.1 hypothetical protein [Nitrosopumilus sp.]MDH3565471.1 hypothetical protein [Nitrosopumilus sp.]MDH5416960.1 hypothetical protein [Nitrosopumilus sp.]
MSSVRPPRMPRPKIPKIKKPSISKSKRLRLKPSGVSLKPRLSKPSTVTKQRQKENYQKKYRYMLSPIWMQECSSKRRHQDTMQEDGWQELEKSRWSM